MWAIKVLTSYENNLKSYNKSYAEKQLHVTCYVCNEWRAPNKL